LSGIAHYTDDFTQKIFITPDHEALADRALARPQLPRQCFIYDRYFGAFHVVVICKNTTGLQWNLKCLEVIRGDRKMLRIDCVGRRQRETFRNREASQIKRVASQR
jgi:hypothetical protein